MTNDTKNTLNDCKKCYNHYVLEKTPIHPNQYNREYRNVLCPHCACYFNRKAGLNMHITKIHGGLQK